MRKLLILMVLLGAITAVLRFAEVEAPQDNRPAPALTCREAGAPPHSNVPSCESLRQIGTAYEKGVLPIFAAKCLMCHGVVPKMPLYAQVPPSSWLVQYDIKAAKEQIDMSFGFPFQGKEAKTPSEALSEIAEVVRKGSMPPLVYKIMHWRSSLTAEEAQIILDWTNQGMGALK